MRPDQQSGQDEHLDAVLRGWAVDAPLPPRFQDEVWNRIARAETAAESSLWTAVIRWVEVALPRPRVAFAYVAALVVLGVSSGAFMAQVKSSQLDLTLRTRYVQSVDPYRGEAEQP